MSQTAAIYARFSTDRQDERSVDDQIAMCREYAGREGLTVTRTFEDRAISGASMSNRPGILALMDAARQGLIGAIIVESLDRLSRDMEDLAHIYKRIKHMGIEIRALHDGPVNTVLIGLRGLIGQMYREDGALRVRARMKERVRAGGSGGGLAYGYEAVQGQPGVLRIVEEQAIIVRRIFAEYLDGKSPRDIVSKLNAERVPAPRGSRWNASTINGSKSRGNGILANALYDGRIVWNKVRMVKDPDTGKRLSRPNAPDAYLESTASHLRVVSAEMFAAAQDRHGLRTKIKPTMLRRPKHLLSGLLRCGCCSGGMSLKDTDRKGRRIMCSAVRESDTCTNGRNYYLDDIERRVLSGLDRNLRDPRAIEGFAAIYSDERRKLAAGSVDERERIERRLTEIGAEIARGTDALLKGRAPEEIIGPALTELARERSRLTDQISDLAPTVNVFTLQPPAIATYLGALNDLAGSLATAVRSGDSDAARAMRDLVESITISPADGPPLISVRGRLTALTLFPGPSASLLGLSGGSSVADSRYHRSPRQPLFEFAA
jgi:DNA invertase Pin-like site-specific DNA recombinase